MRPSKRDTILAAAIRVVELHGVAAVTYESVADEASLTKGGILYHFPSRDSLLSAVQEFLAAHWESSMLEAAGTTSAETLSEGERLAAYARIAAHSATRAELLLILEAATNTERSAPWTGNVNRWTPPLPTSLPPTAEQMNLIIARLAADGLWLHDTITGSPMPSALRDHIAAHLAHLADPATDQTDDVRPSP
ncbi:TetR/AcrR family transcriptional regulator (plasmid) [Rhodococcus sp. NBC_00297]